MLQLVNVGHKSLADYASLASRGLMTEIRRLAEPLQGKRIVHLSATAFGGGVAEINYALVPLMADVGLDVEWRIIQGEDEFFGVTKTIHNALQGDPRGLTKEQEATFRRYNALNAEQFEDDYDYVIVHDPQPAAMVDHFPDSDAHWIWRCHIDLSTPNLDVLGFLAPSLERYRGRDLPHAPVRAAPCRAPAGGDLAARDRPADAEEHGPFGRGRHVRRRSVRRSTSSARSSRRSRVSTRGRTRSA